jgi:hypothetical protein
MTYDKSTLTVEPTSRDRVLTPAFLLVAAATLFAFLSIGVVLPVLPRYTEGPLGTGSVGVRFGVCLDHSARSTHGQLAAQPSRDHDFHAPSGSGCNDGFVAGRTVRCPSTDGA